MGPASLIHHLLVLVPFFILIEMTDILALRLFPYPNHAISNSQIEIVIVHN